jgi:hypothetical protein
MRPFIAAALIGATLLAPLSVDAKIHRSRQVTVEFQRQHPCPSTGKTRGACPGWIKDHIVALCKGGPDAVSNLQWQTVAEAHAKDKWECK